ncbi:hypothetical protein CH92_14890 [Stutzerimonas stutzeri]|uniref:Endolytic peptidoglycan transglycosylase RlpA n=1 Tax=Stutzerimonas stutzeri TaxID=316 RepID=W8R126_STUST|nr:septal ring lytic transglycosylase RlpA family protein [Stutzerimonas stutzeri]AHL76304.1 hypothetical protein CH92_14890 [Stutzerimonas stutzeri]MCQ4329536.1 septal ring lytic transglycosylase RlpA family protein [Stutzerimonas stutzeri]
MLNGSIRWIVALSLIATLFGCSTPPPKEPLPGAKPQPSTEQGDVIGSGKASYYGSQHHNKLTASGERFDQTSLSAAHRTLPFGTKVRVINTRNGNSVVVRINDRGPFVRGRIIDLSKAAFQSIGNIRSGVLRVRLEKVD